MYEVFPQEVPSAAIDQAASLLRGRTLWGMGLDSHHYATSGPLCVLCGGGAVRPSQGSLIDGILIDGSGRMKPYSLAGSHSDALAPT
eukprot:CAMPEP_0115831506 /NCGR_PEP_ID=MMETSP0287-20121206/2174_1 /TAXON_ID=412157 /ORGANISM="Chrysochromulina rotalis, Strain UIO044" /LENGTH=86 /DNA_ID=CAMNT_0003284855 /DNA_START=80 /DNA_END=341 /DNA_ORIENTATION=+